MGASMNNEFDRAIDETRAFLAARPAPDLTAAVMSRIETLEPASEPQRGDVIARLLMFLWAPREISIRPAFALAGAAAIVMLVIGVSRDRLVPAPQFAERAADPHLFVQFRLDADASRVQLAGSFTNWEPRYELNQVTPGVWTITVPLTQGVHDYAFIVDGQQWVPDPHAPQIGDGFGGTNSRLALLSPNIPQL
jgi:hypothetical protein